MLTYVVLIHSDPNNMNQIVYHLIIVRYSMKTLHWFFPWATALHLCNMTGRSGKLQQLHCYHPFSDSLDIYLTKNHYENYSPKMVPVAKIWGPGSWTTRRIYFISIYCVGIGWCITVMSYVSVFSDNFWTKNLWQILKMNPSLNVIRC